MGGMILFIFYGSILFFIIATGLRVKRSVDGPHPFALGALQREFDLRINRVVDKSKGPLR